MIDHFRIMNKCKGQVMMVFASDEDTEGDVSIQSEGEPNLDGMA